VPAPVCPRGTCASAIFVSLAGRKIIPAISQARRRSGAVRFFLTHFSLGEDMKASFLAVCGTAVVMLVSALAETKTTPRVEPESLARMDAITSYCEKVDPASEAGYRSKLNDLVSGHSSDELLADRAGAKYRKAMTQANETLARVSPWTEAKSCGEFLAENY